MDDIKNKIKEIKNIVGKDKVVCGISGGIDSSVTAHIIKKAINKNTIKINILYILGTCESCKQKLKMTNTITLILYVVIYNDPPNITLQLTTKEIEHEI